MKKNYIYILLFAFLFIGNSAIAQKKNKAETNEFKVYGLCNMCKERIEEAALIKGVKLNKFQNLCYLRLQYGNNINNIHLINKVFL